MRVMIFYQATVENELQQLIVHYDVISSQGYERDTMTKKG